MINVCANPLEIINSITHSWVALTDLSGNILCHNKDYANRFGDALSENDRKKQKLSIHIGGGHDIQILLEKTIKSRQCLTIEKTLPVSINKNEHPHRSFLKKAPSWLLKDVSTEIETYEPVWFRTMPIGECIIVEMVPTNIWHALELHYLSEIRSTPHDNLWVFQNDLKILWARVDEKIAIDWSVGRPIQRLLSDKGREHLLRGMDDARGKPAEIIRLEDIELYEGKNKINIDISYLPSRYGNNFYAASRAADEPRAIGMIGRLMEAYVVSTQSELAKMLGVGKSSISHHRDSDDLPLSWLMKCCQDNRVSMDWLVYGIKPRRFL